MVTPVLERKLLVEDENFTRSLPFMDFIEKTAPRTKNTPLSRLAQSLVNRLSYLCQPDEHDNFALIRGGSMRSFLLNNYVTDERFAELFDGIEPQLLGENHMAKQVVDKVFSLPKDIDIFFRVTTPHHQFHQDNILFSTIIEHLEQSGFTGLFRNGDKMRLHFLTGSIKSDCLGIKPASVTPRH